MVLDRSSVEPNTEDLPAEQQDRLARILDDYLVAVEKGAPVSPEELLEQHPEDAPYLEGYLSALELFHAGAVAINQNGSTASLAGEPPGKTVGDYQLLRELGRGGMGVVYEAMQTSLRRRVALKVLPFTAAHNPPQISRFKNEAQAAAQVHHPNIVPVYAVGEDHGVHYYAMQLVDGQSLTSMLEELRGVGPLDETVGEADIPPLPATTIGANQTADHVRAVARLGIQAAEALHAAHEYGIVHRDVKPSNLMVDDHGKLWVTDFGLARCLENNGLTQSGDILGTMRYMSPEQAQGRAAMVDHRTDIYSLGVTLYELATLYHPVEGADGSPTLAELTHPVCPPPRQRNRHIPADFQTILMKALAELPHERYATAQEMADDLRRFLDGEPILASPPSLLNRAGKWAKRHQGAVATAAGMVLLAVVGLSVSLVVVAGWKAEAERAHAQAQANLEKSMKNEKEAKTNFERAQENFHQACTVLDRLGKRAAEQLTRIPGAGGVRHQLLEESIGFYQQLKEQSSDDPSLQADQALAYSKIGSLFELMGAKQRALAAHTDARELLVALVDREPANTEYLRNLALCDNNLGSLLTELGRGSEALDSLRRAEKLQDELRAANPDSDELAADSATTYSNLGLVLSQTGATDEAVDYYHRAIPIQERLVDTLPDDEAVEAVLRSLAASYNNLGSLQQTTDVAATKQSYRHAIDIQRRLVSDDATNYGYQSDLARTYNNLGYVYARQRHWTEADRNYNNAILIQENLVRAVPMAASYRRDLAVSYNNLGMVESQAGRLNEAEDTFREALRLQQLLLAAHPDDGQTLSNLGGVFNNLAMVLDRQNRPLEAEKAYLKAIGFQKRALDSSPTSQPRRDLLSRHYFNYGRNLRSQGRPADAVVVALDRKELWLGHPERLYSVAQELAATYDQMKGQAHSDPQAEGKCLDAVVATLREAVHAGLPAARLTDASFAALADRDDYRQLLTETHAN